MTSLALLLLALGLVAGTGELVGEITEVLGVIRLGVSLVSYINTVARDMCGGQDSDGENCHMDLNLNRVIIAAIRAHRPTIGPAAG